MKDLTVKQETIRILEKNTSNNLFDLGCSNFLLDVTGGKGNKSKNELVGLNQGKSFCKVKEKIKKTKRQPMDWEKILANGISDKELVSRGAWVTRSFRVYLWLGS